MPTARILLKTLRPHQWAKNILLFAPAILAHTSPAAELLLNLFVAFCTFSLTASSVYIINDLADIEDDKHHPTKKLRPIPAGLLSIKAALWIILTLLTLSFSASLAILPHTYTLMLVGYLAINLLYSFWLKQLLLVDVFLLAGFYTWRILAGGLVAGVEVSEWLMAISVFTFTSLAFVKRYIELTQIETTAPPTLKGRAYNTSDISIIESVGPTSGYLAVLVMALYLSGDTVTSLYAQPKILWLTCPLLMYWFTRIWFLAKRGQIHDDPLVFVLRDTASKLVAIGIIAIGVAASIQF